MQYTSKMKMRNVPVIQQYYEKFGTVPQHMALGLAAWLLFMKSTKTDNKTHSGKTAEKEYAINDDYAAHLYEFWTAASPAVQHVLGDQSLWGVNLNALPGLAEAVQSN